MPSSSKVSQIRSGQVSLYCHDVVSLVKMVIITINHNDDNVYRLMFDDAVNAKNGNALSCTEVEVSGRKIQH